LRSCFRFALVAASLLLLLSGNLEAEDVSTRDFVSLGIYYQTVREYYLFPESAGALWYDSTRFALEWMNNALFDCDAGEDMRNQAEELRGLLLSKKRTQTLQTYFELEAGILDFVVSDSSTLAAFECGTYLGQLRFYLPRYLETEDQLLKELYGRLAEEPCVALKRRQPSWEYMISEYYSRTAGNPLEPFFEYLTETCNKPVESTAEELKEELSNLLKYAASIISDF